MSLAEVEDRAIPIVERLRNGGRPNEAQDIARLVADLQRPDKAEGALEGIIARCNIRWLGDLPLNNTSKVEWLQMLNRLEIAAGAELQNVRATAANMRQKNFASATQAVAQGAGKRPAVKQAGKYVPTPKQEKIPRREKVVWRDREDRNKKTRTRSVGGRSSWVGPRKTTFGSTSWSGSGPIVRAGTPLLSRLFFSLAPLALIAYALIVIIDSAPDIYPAPTIVVNGALNYIEERENYSPLATKGVIHLEGHQLGYGIEEALGYGLADAGRDLPEGTPVTLLVDAQKLQAHNPNVSAVFDAIGNANLTGAYDLDIRNIEASPLEEPIPVLEVRSGNGVKYSRLSLTREAEDRITEWGFLAFATALFLFAMARLSAD
ncbi:MAG: hypothetical protein RJB62_1713 [Pseudomonadota bacterium]